MSQQAHRWEFTEYYFPTAAGPGAAAATPAAAAVTSPTSSLPAGLFASAAPEATTSKALPSLHLQPPVEVSANGSYAIADFARLLGQQIVEQQSNSAASAPSAVPCPALLLSHILSCTLDVLPDPTTALRYKVASSHRVTRAMWLEWLKRFGPLEKCVAKASACVGVDGKAEEWFRPEQTRDSVDAYIRGKGTSFTTLIRYKLAASDEQVCSLSLQHAAHYQVFHRSTGYSYPGSPTPFPTLRDLVYSVHSELHAIDPNWSALARSIDAARGEWKMMQECVRAWMLDGRGKDLNSEIDFVVRNWNALTLSALRAHHPASAVAAEFTRTVKQAEAARLACRKVVEARAKATPLADAAVAAAASKASAYSISSPSDLSQLRSRVMSLSEHHMTRVLGQVLEWLEHDGRKVMDVYENGHAEEDDEDEDAAAAEGKARSRRASVIAINPTLPRRVSRRPSNLPHGRTSSTISDASSNIPPSPSSHPSFARVHSAEEEQQEEEKGREDGMEEEEPEGEEDIEEEKSIMTFPDTLQSVDEHRTHSSSSSAASEEDQLDALRSKSWLTPLRPPAASMPISRHRTLSTSQSRSLSISHRAKLPSRLSHHLALFENAQLLALLQILREEVVRDLHEVTKYYSVVMGRMQLQIQQTAAASAASSASPIDYDLPRLRKLEASLYHSLTRLLQLFSLCTSRALPASPPPSSSSSAEADLTWFRFFDLEENKVSVARCAQAVRIGWMQEHWTRTWVSSLALPAGTSIDPTLLHPRVPSVSTLHKMLSATADLETERDGEEEGKNNGKAGTVRAPAPTVETSSNATTPAPDGHLTYSEWAAFLVRFGPFSSCLQKARSVCSASGARAEWFVPQATMQSADELLNAASLPGGSGLKFLVRLGKTPPQRAFVLVLKKDAQATPVHLYISNNLSSSGKAGGLHFEATSLNADVKHHSDFFELLKAVAVELSASGKAPEWTRVREEMEREKETYVDMRHAHPLRLVDTKHDEATMPNSPSSSSSLLLRSSSELSCSSCHKTTSSLPDTRMYQCAQNCSYALCGRCLQAWDVRDESMTGEQTTDTSMSHPACMGAAALSAASPSSPPSSSSTHPASFRSSDHLLHLTSTWSQSAYASRSFAQARVAILRWLSLVEPTPLLTWGRLSVGDVSRFRVGGFSLMHCLVAKSLSHYSTDFPSNLDAENNPWLRALNELAAAGVPVHLPAIATEEGVAEDLPIASLLEDQAKLLGVRPMVQAVMQVRNLGVTPGALKPQHLVALLTSRRLCCLKLVRIFRGYPIGLGSAVSTEEYSSLMMDLLRESVRNGLHRIAKLLLEPFHAVPAASPERGQPAGLVSASDAEQIAVRPAFLALLHSHTSNLLSSPTLSTPPGSTPPPSEDRGTFLHFLSCCGASSFDSHLRLIAPNPAVAEVVSMEEAQRVELAMSTVLDDLLQTFKSRIQKGEFLAAKTTVTQQTASQLAAATLNLRLFDALIFTHSEYKLACNQNGTFLHSICRVWSSADLAARLEKLNHRSIVHHRVVESAMGSSVFASVVREHPSQPRRSLSTPMLRHGLKGRANLMQMPTISDQHPAASSSSSSSSSGPGHSPQHVEDWQWDLAIKLNALDSNGQTALELLIHDVFPAATVKQDTTAASDRKKNLLLFLLERGARLPSDLHKSQLLQISTLLFEAMRGDEALRYSVPEQAVKNGDVVLFGLMFKPLLDRQSCVSPHVERFNTSTRQFESLLLLACDLHACVDEEGLEQRNAAIVEMLIDFKPSMTSTAAPSGGGTGGGKRAVNGIAAVNAEASSAHASDRINYNLEDAATHRNALHLVISGSVDLQSIKNCTAITELLLATRQFDLMASDNTGCNVLHLAAQHGLVQVIDSLILQHVSLDARTLCRDHSASALHIAAEQGEWAICIALLEAGASVNLLDGKGETALTKAMLSKRALEAEIQRRDASDAPADLRYDDPSSSKLSDSALHHLLVRYQRTCVELLKSGASITESCEHSPVHEVDCLVNIRAEFMRIHKKVLQLKEGQGEKEDGEEEEDEDDEDDDEDESARSRIDLSAASAADAEEAEEDDADGDDSYSSAGSDPDGIFALKLTQIVMGELYDQHVKIKHVARLVRFLLTLLLLTFVAVYSNTGDKKSAYFLTQQLGGTFAGDAFSGIGSREDVWPWMKDAVVGSIYNDDEKPSPGEPTYVLGTNRLIGLVRLRQVRSKPLEDSAMLYYTPAGSDTSANGPPSARVMSFPYRSSSELHGARWSGQYQTYDGSGWTVLLPPPSDGGAAKKQAHTMVKTLSSSHWLDSSTKALFVEFTLHNSVENHFVICTLLLEFPPTGGAMPSADFSIQKLVRYVTREDHIIMCFQVLLLLLFSAYFYTEFQELRSQGITQYVRSFYNAMDVVMFLLLATIVTLHLYGMYLSATLDWSSTTEYIPVQQLSSVLWWHCQLSSLLVFIAMLKSIEFFAVFKDVSRLTVMIEMVLAKLVPFLVVLLISLVAFASATYISYGYKDAGSYTWLFSLLSSVNRTFNYDADFQDWEFMRAMYACVFAIFICLIMLNLVVAILNSAYEDALEDSGDAYWSKKQYGMIINILQKKKAGTVNLYDRLLEKLVLLFSSLSWPALPFTKSSSSASAARKSTQHLTLEDLDAMDEDDDASSSSSRMKPEGIVRSKSLRSRRQQTSRLHGISTAPAWTKVIPTACKHGAPKPPQRKISRSSSAREMKRSPATAAAGLRSMIVGARFPYTRID